MSGVSLKKETNTYKKVRVEGEDYFVPDYTVQVVTKEDTSFENTNMNAEKHDLTTILYNDNRNRCLSTPDKYIISAEDDEIIFAVIIVLCILGFLVGLVVALATDNVLNWLLVIMLSVLCSISCKLRRNRICEEAAKFWLEQCGLTVGTTVYLVNYVTCEVETAYVTENSFVKNGKTFNASVFTLMYRTDEIELYGSDIYLNLSAALTMCTWYKNNVVTVFNKHISDYFSVQFQQFLEDECMTDKHEPPIDASVRAESLNTQVQSMVESYRTWCNKTV